MKFYRQSINSVVIGFTGAVFAPLVAAQNTDNPPAVPAPAKEEITLLDSVKAGISTSPRLASKIHGLEALIQEADVVFGDMLPTVDLRGATGRERSKITNGESSSYNANSYGVEARQNLFNGFANQARYLGSHSTAMAEYYLILEESNQITLESAVAHANVARFQALTKLAESNVNYHKDIMQRIEEKVQNGVSRPADLEQARSRYTLALSNLATEKANTFSAMADYQKVTDQIWPVDQMGDYVIETNFEIANPERLVYALNNHAMLQSANSTIFASNYSIEAAQEGFFPRIDLRAKSDMYSNYLSSDQERQISSIDLLATVNIYRGGADKAAKEAAIRRKHQAMDQKLLVCKIIRRNTQVALYDVMNLQKRYNYFVEQTQAITNARAAYEQQFRIGRRDLLDLLNAENEYYQAQRNLINIEADLSVSKLKLLGASGQLVELFGIEDLLEANEPTKRNVILYKEHASLAESDLSCPAGLINLENFDLPSIGFEPALKSVGKPVGPVNPGVEVAQLGNPGNIVHISNQPGARALEATDPAAISPKLIQQTNKWASAWEARDINRYIDFYSPFFEPEEGSYEHWQQSRRLRIGQAREIDIAITDIQVIPSFDKPDVYETVFIQKYSASHYREESKKVLTWQVQEDGTWLIIREQNLPKNTVYEGKATSTSNLAMNLDPM
ncbi:MAG: TolC family protein [Limnobacter sp.]|nr:TolC family protein [Limnobacter sp.]